MELRKSKECGATLHQSELLIIYPSYEYGVGVEFQNNVRFLSAGQGGQIRSDSCCSIPAPLRLGVARSLCNNFDSNPQEYLEKFSRKFIEVIDLLKYYHSILQIFLFKIENRGNFIRKCFYPAKARIE